MAEVVDRTLFIAAIVVPIPLVFFLRFKGVVLGAVWVWGVLIAAGYWLSALDPDRDCSLFDSFWVLGGWLAGGIYCTLIYAVISVVRALAGGNHTSSTGKDKTS